MEEARELEIRKALSKMLNAPFKPQKQYDYGERERVVFSWDEIFFELGRLSEKNGTNHMYFSGTGSTTLDHIKPIN